MRTYVYVDGFNLYYGALKGTPYRWLNLSTLLKLLLPQNEIAAIKYFTALVKPRANDPLQSVRQQVYLRALATLPDCSTILGHFLAHQVSMPLADSSDPQRYAKVIKTEEKGSDVNLATHLLCDAFDDSYDVAVVVTNDSDLAEPLRIVHERFGKIVGILNPHKHPSRVLMKHAGFFKQIRTGVLRVSQFPDRMQDFHGTFHRPEGW